jgi:hypothetical protein
MGNLSLMVNLLRAQKSGYMCQEPSFFKTFTIKDEYGLVLGQITTTSSNSYTIFSILFLEKMDTCRGIHWRSNFLEGEGCCDHAHPRRGVGLWVSQIPCGVCSIPIADTYVLVEMIDHAPGWN